MAITTLKLWMAPESNRLLAGPSSFSPAQNPVFYEGNTARIELHILAGAGIGKIPYEVAFPAGSSIKLAVGQVNAFPTSGTWQLSVDSIETADMPFNATPAQVQTALNALASVQAAGGVTCALNGDGYTVTWNTYGAKPDIGIGSDTLVPSSYESISLVQQGTADFRKVIYIELRQAPVALGVDWDPLPAPVMSVEEITAWNGTTQTWRFGIEPAPKAGSYNITVAGASTKSYNFSYSATADNITTKISADFPNAKAYKTGEAQFDIVFQEEVILTADGNGLIGYLGYVGNVNFSTAEVHQFIGGLAGRQTTLEVAIEAGGIPQTLIQVPCFVSSDVISNGVLQPLPLGTAMSEQVANARFVRRDLDQNPDGATQNQIWSNLGLVNNDGTDVIAALAYASSPSFANPFVTLSDISGLGATWGNIIGTLSDQTDLQTALDGKYDASNPNGYIQDASADGNLYGRKNGMWEVVPSYSSVWGSITGTLSDQTDLQGALDGKYDASNPAGFIDASYLSGYATEAWVTGNLTAYVLQVQLNGYATESWVSQQGYATESWVQTQGFVYSDSYGRVHIGAGYNPDPSPVPGLFWYQSEKLRFSNSTSSINTVASEAWSDAKFQTLAGMSSYLTTSAAATTYYPLVGNPYGFVTQTVADANYAKLSGATFTGKVNFTSVSGAAGLNIGIGGTSASATNFGDIWISTGGTNLNFRDGTGAWRILVNTSNTNTFSASQIIDTTSATAALRVTQKGTGNAIEIEDSTTPDATRFVVDQYGKVGVGVAPDATAAIKVDGNGISFNGVVINPTGTAAHSGGTDTLDLLVTINGTSYRIGLRPA
jgi:hypothetical protein